MVKVLRIVFCILSVVTAAAAVFIFVFTNWLWGIIDVAACLVFAACMFICRNAQRRQEERNNPPAPVGDFITGKITDKDNQDK